jgi:hypothetical protein
MKIRLKLFTWLFLLCCFTLQLQSQEIITTSGGYGSASNAKVSWTIGEPVTETVVGLNIILNQGFNQGEVISTSLIKAEIPGLTIRVYPNPASDHLELFNQENLHENLRYTLIDLNGKVLIENKCSGIYTSISIGNLKPSTYLLKVFLNNKEISVFKIIKK